MDILRKIEKLRAERGWTIYKLAEESALTLSTVANMFHRKGLPSLSTLIAICDGFGISMAEFFAEEGEFNFSTEEIELIKKYRELSSKHKTAIKNLIENLDNN